MKQTNLLKIYNDTCLALYENYEISEQIKYEEKIN